MEILSLVDSAYRDHVEVHVNDLDLGAFIGKNGHDTTLPWGYVDGVGEPKTVFDENVIEKGAEAAMIFTCGCGECGCSCTYAKVTVEESTTTLSNFVGYLVETEKHQPIVFDRKQFMDEVHRFKKVMRRKNSIPPK